MDTRHDTLRIEKCNGNENEDFSFRSLLDMAVLEGNRIQRVVDGPISEPPKEDADAQALYTEKTRIAREKIIISLGGKPLQVIQEW